MSETVSGIREENKREEKPVRATKTSPGSAPYVEIDGVTAGESSTDADEDGEMGGAPLADLDRLMKRLGRREQSQAGDTESSEARARGEAAAAYFEEGNWQWNSQYGDLLPWIVSKLDLASSVRLILKIDGQPEPVVFGGDDAERTHEIILCRSSDRHLEHYYPEGQDPDDFPGDGDCFYRAFLYCLLGYVDADAISYLRAGVIRYLRANPEEVGEKIFGQYDFEGASALDKSVSILKKPGSYESAQGVGAKRTKRLRFGASDITEALPESLTGKSRRRQTQARKELRTLQENYRPQRTRQRLAAEYEANRLVDEVSGKTKSVVQQLNDLTARFVDVLHYGGSGHRQGFETYRNSAEAIRNIDRVLLADTAGDEIARARTRMQHARQRYLGAVLAREVSTSLTRVEETRRALLAQQDPSDNASDDPLTRRNKTRNSWIVSAEGQLEQEKITQRRKGKKRLSAQEHLDEARNSHEEAKYFYRLFAETFAREYGRVAAWLGTLIFTSDAFIKSQRLKPLNDFAKSLQNQARKREDEKADAFFRTQEEQDTKPGEESGQETEDVMSASSSAPVVKNMNAFFASANTTAGGGAGAIFSDRPADPAETSARSPQERRQRKIEMKVMIPVIGAGIAGRVANQVQAGDMDGVAEEGRGEAAAPLVNAGRALRNGRREGARGNGYGRSRLNALFWLVIGSLIAGVAVWAVTAMIRAFSGAIKKNASAPAEGDEDLAAPMSETSALSATSAPAIHSQDRTTEAEHASGRASGKTTGLVSPEDVTAASDESTEKPNQTEDDFDDEMQKDVPAPDNAPRTGESENSRLDEIVRRQIRHDYRIQGLPAAAAGEWGTSEDGVEEETVQISRVGGRDFAFQNCGNQTLVVEEKPTLDRIYLYMFGGEKAEEVGMCDVVFFPLIKKGYLINARIKTDTLNSRLQIIISKRGEKDSTFYVAGRNVVLDSLLNNINFEKNNFSSIDAGIKGEKAEQYRKTLQRKVFRIFLSKERNPVILRKNQVLVVDKIPDGDETIVSLPRSDGTDTEIRNFDFRYLFRMGYGFDSMSFDQIDGVEDEFTMIILFKKRGAADITFNTSPVRTALRNDILSKLLNDQEEVGKGIDVQLTEKYVMSLKEDLIINTSRDRSTVIHIPDYSKKPPYAIKFRLFHKDDSCRFSFHPKGHFEFEIMKLKGKPENNKNDNRLLNVMGIRDFNSTQSNLQPSDDNNSHKRRHESDLKRAGYFHKNEKDFKLTITSEDHDEQLYRGMEKKIDEQIVEMEEAEFRAYQSDVSFFANEYFTTTKNIDAKHKISLNRRELLIKSVYKYDYFIFDQLKHNATFFILDQTNYSNRTADLSLGVSLIDFKYLVRKSGPAVYYIKEFQDAYSGAHIIISTGDMEEMAPVEAGRARNAVDKFADKLKDAALKRKAELSRLIIWASMASSAEPDENELMKGHAIWASLPEWTKKRALRFHQQVRPEVPVWLQMADGRQCPGYSILRDALVLLKGNFIQDNKEEINWSDIPDEKNQPPEKASYRLNIVRNNTNNTESYMDSSYWISMSKSDAEDKKRIVEQSGATVSLEFSIENWVYSANAERNKWSVVTNHFNTVINAVRRPYVLDALALEALLRRMNGEAGVVLDIAVYPLTHMDSISQKRIRDVLYSEYESSSDLTGDAEARDNLIRRLLRSDDSSDTPAQKPEEPPVDTPARPPVDTPARPPVDTPAQPPVEVPDKPAVPPGAVVPIDKPGEDAGRNVPKWVVGLTSVASGGLVVSGTYWGANAVLKTSLGSLARFLRLGAMSTGFVLFPTVATGLTSAASAALFGTGLVGILKALGINVTREMLRRALFVEIAGCGTLIVFTADSASDAVQRAINTNEGKDILDAVARAMATAGTTAVCAAGAGGFAKAGELGFVHRIRSYDDMVRAAAYTGGGLTASSGATHILQCLMGYCSSDANAHELPQAEMLIMPDFAMSAADAEWSEKTGGKDISMSVDAEGKLHPFSDLRMQKQPGNDGDQKKPADSGDDSEKKPSEPPKAPIWIDPPKDSVPDDGDAPESFWDSFLRFMVKYSGGGPRR